jgi:hypothetical protein
MYRDLRKTAERRGMSTEQLEIKVSEATAKMDMKVMAARMGMVYSEIPKPEETMQMDDPKTIERMRHVIQTRRRVPDTFSFLNDFVVAGYTRMLHRNDLHHEGWLCAARDRIYTLSYEKDFLAKRFISSLHGEHADVHYLSPTLRFVWVHSEEHCLVIDNSGDRQIIYTTYLKAPEFIEKLGLPWRDPDFEIVGERLLHPNARLVIGCGDEFPAIALSDEDGKDDAPV